MTASRPEGPAFVTHDRPALERALRTTPDDMIVTLRLALACLQGADPVTAIRHFTAVAEQFDIADAWMGVAASALALGQLDRAADAMQVCLSRHVVPESAWRLAEAVVRKTGQAGWCAMDSQGRLHADAPGDIVLDGRILAVKWTAGTARVPAGATLAITRGGEPLLGSPIDLTAINAVEGFVEAHEGGLSGWAWHPGDPARDPVIRIPGAAVPKRTLTDLRERNDDMRPLARPRRFTVPGAALPPGAVHVLGVDGRDLVGSPVDPGLEPRAAAGIDPERWAPVWADIVVPPNATRPVRRAVDVVVPVYCALGQDPAPTLACLDSVIASLPPGSKLHVVDDCSPDPVMAASLQALAQRRAIKLLRQAVNRGYPAAVNAGMRAAGGRDVVLLNSDTLVPPGWVEALAAAARSAPGIGTACPLSNEATILSVPAPEGGNPMPGLRGTVAQARLAARANGAAVVDIPVGVGFCMFIRRECLNQIGPFREDVFAQGYGEETDFCMRARHRGWRHVAVTGMFVAHHGGASFGRAQQHLKRRNAVVIARLHPGYDSMIESWIALDKLADARLRMDMLRWRASRRKASVVLVTHAGGGGVDQVISLRVAALQSAGIRPIVLRPDGEWVTVEGGGEPTPNLKYRLPGGMAALVRLLQGDRAAHVELHHMLGHDPALLDLAARLGVPHEVYVHDYAWFCPRIALVQEHSYCGEPSLSGCEACIADYGRNVEEPIPVAALVARSAALFGAARRVVAPGVDVAGRLHRHFPRTRAEILPWEDDAIIAPPPPPRAVRHICVIGGIGVEKGYEVLLACLRDVVKRGLPLAFTLVGHSKDDDRLLAAGPITITGRYDPLEADSLIRAQAADIAFLPSIWPETWCFTLGHAWRAGLQALVFDLGTPAERVRRTGWGWVVPLGLPPAALNDWMLRLDALKQQAPIMGVGETVKIQASSRRRNAVI